VFLHQLDWRGWHDYYGSVYSAHAGNKLTIQKAADCLAGILKSEPGMVERERLLYEFNLKDFLLDA